MSETFLYLIRHGETDLNREKRFRGITSAPLNEKGRDEARLAAELIDREIAAIHSSSLERAMETGRIIGEIVNAPVVVDDGFFDIDYGKWQGLTVEEVREHFGGEILQEWISSPGSFRFPGGESMVEVRERVRPALHRLVEDYRGKSVAVVTHMAVMKVCFLVLMELDFPWFWKVDIDNGSVSCFSHRDDFGFMLLWWNRVP